MNGLLSPALRRIRMGVIRPEVSGHVLDFGCSDGTVSEYLDCASYTGIDSSPEALAAARRKYPQHRFISPDEIEALEPRFDRIISLAVIGLLPDQPGFMREMARLLAPGGRIVLTTPHPAINRVHKLGGRLGLVGSDFGYERDEQLPDRAALERLAAGAGLRLLDYRRFMLGANQLAVIGR